MSALERMKSSSYWYGKNRFDSFAPIRLNVAVQWLVDGVSCNALQGSLVLMQLNSVIITGICPAPFSWPRG